MKLSVLYYPHREGHNSIFPLLAYRSAMEAEGIFIRFFTSIDSFLSSHSDFLIVSGFSLPKLLKSRRISTYEFLENCNKRNIPLIYLSGSDSAGPFDHEVIKWVDVYLARQLVKDRSFYLKNHRRHFFRDSYFQEHRFKNEDQFPYIGYTEEEVAKLGVSWNLGLIDWKTQTSSKLLRYFHILRKNCSFPEWIPGENLENRAVDLMFRGNLFRQSHDACRLHRLQTYRVYKKEAAHRVTVPDGLVNYQTYIRELGSSKICLSPFGWGEICYRDFEAFQYRALLFKPDMTHLDTFPDFYSADTLISYDWDAGNLPGKIAEVLDNIAEYQEIADRGFEKFEQLTKGPDSGFFFIRHLKEQMDKSLRIFSKRAIG